MRCSYVSLGLVASQSRVESLEAAVERLQDDMSHKLQKNRELEDRLSEQRAQYGRQQQAFQTIQRQATQLKAASAEMRHVIKSETASTVSDLSRDFSNKLQNHFMLAEQRTKLELVRQSKALTAKAAEAEQV